MLTGRMCVFNQDLCFTNLSSVVFHWLAYFQVTSLGFGLLFWASELGDSAMSQATFGLPFCFSYSLEYLTSFICLVSWACQCFSGGKIWTDLFKCIYLSCCSPSLLSSHLPFQHLVYDEIHVNIGHISRVLLFTVGLQITAACENPTCVCVCVDEMPRGASSSLSVSEQIRAALLNSFSPDQEAKSDISQVCLRGTGGELFYFYSYYTILSWQNGSRSSSFVH